MKNRNLTALTATLAMGLATAWSQPASAACNAAGNTPEAPNDGDTITCDTSPPNPYITNGIGSGDIPKNNLRVDIQAESTVEANMDGVLAGDDAIIDNAGILLAPNGVGIQVGDDASILTTGIIEAGAAGILATGSSADVIVDGTINAGPGPAIQFTSGMNTLTLRVGSRLVGGVVQGGSGFDTLILQDSANTTSDFTNFESLVMQGELWDLEGDVEADDTLVESGTLNITGRLTGDTVLVQDGALGGTGTVDANVTNRATVSPGTSIGVLTVLGEYTQDMDGTLEIEVDENGNSDLLAVTGDVFLGGTLLIASDAEEGFVSPALTWTGTSTGTFDDVEVSRGLAGAVMFEDSVVVVGVGAGVGAVSLPSLDSRVDATLDTGFLFMSSLSGRLQGLRNGTAQSVTQLGGTGPMLASNDDSAAVGLAVQLASAFSGPTRLSTEGGPGLWVRGVGWWGERDAESGALGYEHWLAGVVLGGDWAIGETGFTIGAAFDYTRAWSETEAGSSENDADNFLFGAYLGYDRSNFFFDLALGGGFSNYDSERRMPIFGVPATAKADFDGTNFALRGAGGMDFVIADLFTLRPMISLDYVWAGLNGYRESGAGLGNLLIGDNDVQALKLQGLVVLTQSYDVGSDMKLVPELRTGVVGQFALDDRTVNAALPGVGATGILVGNDSDEVRAALGAGATLQMGSGLSAFIDLGGELGGDTRNATASGGLRYIF